MASTPKESAKTPTKAESTSTPAITASTVFMPTKPKLGGIREVYKDSWVSWALGELLNKSNSHCSFCNRKHSPTTDINTFNATALLILFRYTSNYNTKSIYH